MKRIVALLLVVLTLLAGCNKKDEPTVIEQAPLTEEEMNLPYGGAEDDIDPGFSVDEPASPEEGILDGGADIGVDAEFDGTEYALGLYKNPTEVCFSSFKSEDYTDVMLPLGIGSDTTLQTYITYLSDGQLLSLPMHEFKPVANSTEEYDVTSITVQYMGAQEQGRFDTVTYSSYAGTFDEACDYLDSYGDVVKYPDKNGNHIATVFYKGNSDNLYYLVTVISFTSDCYILVEHVGYDSFDASVVVQTICDNIL